MMASGDKGVTVCGAEQKRINDRILNCERCCAVLYYLSKNEYGLECSLRKSMHSKITVVEGKEEFKDFCESSKRYV